jgi:peptidoglycan lytic transglycosylase
MKTLAASLLALLLAACASAPEKAAVPPAPEKKPGAYYKDDGPGAKPPANLEAIADATPRVEPLNRFANRPYQALGKDYVPLASVQPFRQRGMASWYGKRFHGQKTASGEPYDMYAMTAAHPVLPIPSYARVTNVRNGKSVVVRINDRGPFHGGRVIDLSYAAAYRLGYIQAGSAEVEVEAIVPGQAVPVAARLEEKTPAAEPGIFVQVGAFSERENAESLRAQLVEKLADLAKAELLLSGNLWRLQVGPYPSRDAARSIAERIESAFDLKPLLVVR